MARFTFNKTERLSKEKTIQELFNRGSSFYLYPFKVVYMLNPDQSAPLPQVLISVSSRNFPRAVDRNLIKRRVREAYRLQKEMIMNGSKKGVFAFLYTSRTVLPFEELKAKLFLVLGKIENLDLDSEIKK